jgi:hypothetical protein
MTCDLCAGRYKVCPCSSLSSQMAFGIGRRVSAPLLGLNYALYLITACIAGWTLNHNIDASVSTKHGSYIGNAATFYFLPIVLLASVVGLASTLVGFHHLRVWRTDSLAAAAAASLIAWLITLLAFGLACKEIHIGGHRSRKLKVVEAFTVILAVFELLYLISLHAGILGGEYGPSYTNNNTSATATGPAAGNNIAVSEKHLHGTAAAAAV